MEKRWHKTRCRVGMGAKNVGKRRSEQDRWTFKVAGLGDVAR